MNGTSYARDKVAGLWNAALRESAAVLVDPSMESVHRLRVAVRRLEEALSVFRKLIAKPHRRQAERSLRRWMRAAGRVRDRDIAIELIGEGPWRAQLDRQRASLAAELQTLLRLDPLELDAPHVSPLPDTPPHFAKSSLAECAGPFFSAGEKHAGMHHGAKRLHDLRLSAKSLRYRLEIFADQYGPRLQQLVKSLRKVQDILGSISDASASAKLLSKLGAPRPFIVACEDRINTLQRRFLRVWNRQFPRTGVWLTYLERYAGANAPRTTGRTETAGSPASRGPRARVPGT